MFLSEKIVLAAYHRCSYIFLPNATIALGKYFIVSFRFRLKIYIIRFSPWIALTCSWTASWTAESFLQPGVDAFANMFSCKQVIHKIYAIILWGNVEATKLNKTIGVKFLSTLWYEEELISSYVTTCHEWWIINFTYRTSKRFYGNTNSFTEAHMP